METFYKAYTKLVENKCYYFVKKYRSFPELPDVGEIMDGYGMHLDFNKACSIAGVEDEQIKQQLMAEIQAAIPQAKVIDLNPGDISINSKVGQ